MRERISKRGKAKAESARIVARHKQDYLERDGIGCGVPYGKGIDHDRLLRSLTVTAKSGKMLILAYKAKGRSAFEALLFARYLMYTAVYWHHAFRSMQAMFVHAGFNIPLVQQSEK